MNRNQIKKQLLGNRSGTDGFKILKTAVEKSPAAIAVTDEAGRHIWHNNAFGQLFGYTLDDLDGKTHEMLLKNASEFKRIKVLFVAPDPLSMQFEVKDKYGRQFDVDLSFEPLTDMQNNVWSQVWFYEDVSTQRKIRKDLMFQHEYLSTLHAISLGMFRRLNLSDLLRAIIVRACKLTHIPNGFLFLYNSKEDVLEIRAACGSIEQYVGLKINADQGISGKVFKTGEPMIIDNYHNWTDKIKGQLYDNIHSIVCIPLISGSKVIGVIGLTHDKGNMAIHPDIVGILEEFSAIAQIAVDNAMLFEQQKDEFTKRIVVEKERKEIEAKLFQAQRMESIGALAGGIAHDFNNILSAIMGYTQIAMDEFKKGANPLDDLSEIYNASLRARDLVHQILTFARQSDDRLNAVRVNLIAKEVLKFIRSSIPSTIEIRENIESREKVLANPTQLYQIFLNLYTNAAQAMAKKGGLLKVDMVNADLTREHGKLLPGRYIEIRISDTGTGISETDLSKIFEPYFTTKAPGEGTGLGLSVVHGAVKSMKGNIEVDSTPGKGTVFTIWLPIFEKDSPAKDTETGEIPLGNKEHILFIDDETTIARVGKRMLETLNYRATALTDSMNALELFRSAPDRFKAVVTDWTMPNMTGDKLVNEIHRINPKMPVLLCTGLEEEISDKRLKEFGFRHFFRKPISKFELAKALFDALNPNRSGGSSIKSK